MANPLSRFNLSSSSTPTNVKYVDYICSLDPLGDFKKVHNIDVIINSWNNILLTPRGSYDHDPQYGSGLYDIIFQPAIDDTRNNIIREIYNSLYFYDNRAKIDNIDIKFLKNSKGYSVTITLSFEGETKDMSLKFKSIK